jgi:rRNA maturation endonuclease Nob1
MMDHGVLDVPAERILNETTLMHEHDLIAVAIKDVHRFLIRCITCGIYYCNLCGKSLEKQQSTNITDFPLKIE